MNRGMRFLGLSTADARAFAGNLQSQIAQVTQVLGEMQQQVTPSSDEISAAVSASSVIENAIRQFMAQDGPNAYAASTQDALQRILAVEKVIVDEQQQITQHANTGFVSPPDPGVVAQAVANWQGVLQDINTGLADTAAQIDLAMSQSSAQASAGAAAQAAQQAGGAGGGSTSAQSAAASAQAAAVAAAQAAAAGSTGTSTSTSSSGSTVVTPPALSPVTTPARASILPSMTPAAWVFVGLGGLLLLGVWTGYVDLPKPVAAVLGPSPKPRKARKKNPRPRRAVRRKRGRS